MKHRISPIWWPALILASPILVPALLVKNCRFIKDINKVRQLNKQRIDQASFLELPELEFLKLTVLIEEKKLTGFQSTPGICYKIETDKGALLFDIGFGPEEPGLAKNAEKLNFSLDNVDGLVISHLHPDHMGGFKAVRENRLIMPLCFGDPKGMPCFLPAHLSADGFDVHIIDAPQLIVGGVASTGPLARSLFLMGRVEEQVLVCRIKNKGLVIIIGCGHPTIEKILMMAKKISPEPIYAIFGGLHLPVTDSPLKKPGLEVQMIWGTGKPPWKKITDRDLDAAIGALNRTDLKKMFLSHHDCCAYSAKRINQELKAEVSILKSGATYSV